MFFFFFNDTATTEIYTLSLHDALPISWRSTPTCARSSPRRCNGAICSRLPPRRAGDRKSTRLNSSHLVISYAVFCLKKKKTKLFYNIATQTEFISLIFNDTLYPSTRLD